MKRLLIVAIIGIMAFAACLPQQVDIPDLTEYTETRTLTIPDKDVFSGSEILDSSSIGQSDLEAVSFRVNLEDGGEDEIIVTNSRKLAEIYKAFASSRIAVDIMSTTPDTGNQLDMIWYLNDKTQIEFQMRGYLSIGGHNSIYGTYVFTEGASQQDFISLYRDNK